MQLALRKLRIYTYVGSSHMAWLYLQNFPSRLDIILVAQLVAVHSCIIVVHCCKSRSAQAWKLHAWKCTHVPRPVPKHVYTSVYN